MSTPLVFALPGNETLAETIRIGILGEEGKLVLRDFPDGESYLRILNEVAGRNTIVVCSLNKPNTKILPLLFLLRLLKDLTCKSVTLVSPYLAYMRQDKSFQQGEAVTSAYFATLLSPYIDCLITVSPHLHRRKNLNEIYNTNCVVLQATELIAKWIKTNIKNALLIGPDSESEQWTASVAEMAGVPFLIAEKHRDGDRNVKVLLPEIVKFEDKTPVILDDIISSATTMIVTAEALKTLEMPAPFCIGVHAVCNESDYNRLKSGPIAGVITCNTITHQSNAIEISALIITALRKLFPSH